MTELEKLASKYVDEKPENDGFYDAFIAGYNAALRSAYFDIPNSEMSYATYSTKAYFDERGWYLIDCDGKKQYEDEKWLKVSPHYA
jgi:hypothetical protein